MDPAEFGISTLPLHHSPYPSIFPSTLAKFNKGKLAVVTGAAGGKSHPIPSLSPTLKSQR
jgi:hypothetical protein